MYEINLVQLVEYVFGELSSSYKSFLYYNHYQVADLD